MHDRWIVIRDETGNPVIIEGIVRDNTERKRLEEEQRRDRESAERLAEEIAVIAEIGRLISSTLDIEEVYERFAAEARKLIPFDSLIVNLKKPREDTLDVAYASGADIPERRKGDSFPLKGSVSEVAMRTRTGLIVRSADILKKTGRFSTLGINLTGGAALDDERSPDLPGRGDRGPASSGRKNRMPTPSRISAWRRGSGRRLPGPSPMRSFLPTSRRRKSRCAKARGGSAPCSSRRR